MKLVVYIFFMMTSMNSLSQNYLNDTTLYNSLWCTYISVYEVDSGYFTLGNIVRSGNGLTASAILGFHDENGNKNLVLDNYELNNDQRIFGSIHKLFMNHAGNFLSLYDNLEYGVGQYPRLKEITPNGIMTTDISFLPLLDSLNYTGLDGNNILQKQGDSSYIIMANVVDTAKLSMPNQGGGGLLLIHLDKDFNLLDTVSFFPQGALVARLYVYSLILESGDETILLTRENYQASPSSLEEDRLLFITLDSLNQVIDTSYYTDGQKIMSPYGLTSTIDGGYLFSYLKAEWSLAVNGWEYYRYLCKVDSNFALVWKKLTDQDEGYPGGYQEKEIKTTLDENYVFVGASVEDSSSFSQGYARMVKFTDSGDFLWTRRFFGIIEDSIDYPPVEYLINDVIATKDSGYCLVGQVVNHQVPSSSPRYYGYLVKTNCLGFLGNAVASASFSYEDNFELSFYNNSMQAGSYFWDFGDGTTMTTGEGVDTIYHSYPSPPEALEGAGYDVMLIAYGCYDSLGVRDADTVLFSVAPKLHKDPTVVTHGNGYFTLFPNPIVAGSSLYVYLNGLNPDDGEVAMKIFSNDGKYVARYVLSASEGSYELSNQLGSGEYFLVLEQGGEKLEVERLVVF